MNDDAATDALLLRVDNHQAFGKLISSIIVIFLQRTSQPLLIDLDTELRDTFCTWLARIAEGGEPIPGFAFNDDPEKHAVNEEIRSTVLEMGSFGLRFVDWTAVVNSVITTIVDDNHGGNSRDFASKYNLDPEQIRDALIS